MASVILPSTLDTTFFADIILPLHLRTTFTYRIPNEYDGKIEAGQRVVVQFGAKKLYSGLVRRVHSEVPNYQVKYILSIVDTEPIVGEEQFQLWEWMSRYYMCYIGDVMAVALPSILRLASESMVTIHPDFDGELSSLTDKELRIVQLLSEQPVMKVNDISVAISMQKIMPVINGMIERGILIMDEDLQQRFKPAKATYLSLAPKYQDESEAKQLFDELEKKKNSAKQLGLMLRFMQLSGFGKRAIAKKELASQQDFSASSLATLIKNGVIVAEERTASRLKHYDKITSPDTIELNEEQQAAYDSILSHEGVTLLHGVTSSGKTEVYIKLIQETINRGRQALFLLPEIALTAQIINRLRKYFGDSVGVYHSRFSPSQRAEVWSRTFSEEPDKRFNVLLGARSAIFLPFRDLGLVIVDEEHDSSYKQYEPAPRYNCRDSAVYLANLWKARTVLGSATPSIESYYNTQCGKYALVEMKHRYGGLKLPEVLCVDMKDASRKKEVTGYFSNFLSEHIRQALDNKEQVILFQNRRGYSLRIECEECHWTPQCQHCDVSLVYHRSTNSLRCHYCGYSIPMPTQCPVCGKTNLKTKGFGTERIEDEIAQLFPSARVARMDMDTTMTKNRHLEIISDFEDRKTDILVGTQMVTKGLDFDNVSVVGILSADNLINFPDFRSFERSFQQMMQVAGRAGRHGQQGKVIIQTYNPWHQAVRDVIDNNYAEMYRTQIIERRVFRYPPFNKLIEIILRSREEDLLNTAAAQYAALLREKLSTRVLGPEYPSVSRIRGYYLKRVIVRVETNDSLSQVKQIILDTTDALQAEKDFKQLKIHFDPDPQ